MLIALAQNGALRLRCDSVVVSLVGEDGSSRIVAEAGQSTLLTASCDRSASLHPSPQQHTLDRAQSLALFQGRRPAEQSKNVIADQTRHVVRDMNLWEKAADGTALIQTSYAAVPVRSASGQVLGMYSVLDSRKRHDFLDHETYRVLDDIASATSQYLETQHLQRENDHDTRARLNLTKILEHSNLQRAGKLDTPRRVPSLTDHWTEPPRETLISGSTTSSSSTSACTSLDGSVFSRQHSLSYSSRGMLGTQYGRHSAYAYSGKKFYDGVFFQNPGDHGWPAVT